MVKCSIDETNYILEKLNKLSDYDNELYEQKILNNIKIKYLNATKKNKKIQSTFEKIIVNQDIYDIKILFGHPNLYRIEIDHFVYPQWVVYSFNKNEIVVNLICNNYVQRTQEIKDKLSHIKKNYPRILSTRESIEYILDNQCSLSRYGDGELNLCYGKSIGFQDVTDDLKNRLIKILQYGSDTNILITLPEFNSKINNIENCFGQISFWENYWLRMYKNLNQLFAHKFYGNTDISRNTVFYDNELNEIKRLWDKREVVFVIGENGRFEMKPELFNNVLSYKVVYVPPVNAYHKYPEILDSCLKFDKNKLFLVAAGPTATVLVFDLMQNEYQALDIGHLPNCYDQYLGKINYPETIPHIRSEN